jgi:hypothetical protein
MVFHDDDEYAATMRVGSGPHEAAVNSTLSSELNPPYFGW